MRIPAPLALIITSLTAALIARAESLLPYDPVPLNSLAAFQPGTSNWHIAGGVSDAWRKASGPTVPGTGVLVNYPISPGNNQHLLTRWEHGDIDLELDFLLPPKSNSGVYLQGRYEVQLFDSWRVTSPSFADAGGIYQRWDPARGIGREGFEGHAPKANASRAPGLWQHLEVRFRAPSFDSSGKKITNARFLKVALNGTVVQENVEVTGPTRSAVFDDERPTGPLMIQGDHGSVAIRNLVVKRYGSLDFEIKGLAFKYYNGPSLDLETYATSQVSRESAPEHFGGAVLSSDDRGVAVFTGTLDVPVNGLYAFRADSIGPARLRIDNRMVVYPGVNSPQVGTVSLEAGSHAFKVEQQHEGFWALRDGGLKIWAEGPGIPLQQLAPAPPQPESAQTASIPVEAEDRINVQRTFVRLGQSRRLYACFVGSPAGIHYAYDLEQACVIGFWRGGFFDGRDLWHERAEKQEARVAGPALWIEGKPLLFQFGDHDVHWPNKAPPTSRSLGYRLEEDGQPVFLYHFSGVQAEDRIAPLPDGTGLNRKLKFSGSPRERDMWALLAEASQITLQADGSGYVIGDRGFYLDWPEDSLVKPTLRHERDRMQLLVRVPDSGAREITYNLVW